MRSVLIFALVYLVVTGGTHLILFTIGVGPAIVYLGMMAIGTLIYLIWARHHD